jgi:putative membrane protein (TIGR04086 family)
MDNIKNYLIAIEYFLLVVVIFAIVLTIFNYYDIVTNKLFKVIKVLIPSFALFIGGYKVGNSTNKKGYIEGIKLSLIVIVLLFMFSYLGFNASFNISLILYYIILIISSMLGAMIGINKKITSD